MDPKALIIGYDLGTELSQIAVGSMTEEPDSICITPNSGDAVIPTVLCVRNDSKDWLFGEEAVRFHNRNAGYFVDDILNKVIRGESEVIFDIEYSADELLTRFVRKTMSAVHQKYVNDTVEKVVVTTRTITPALVEAVLRAMEETGIRRDRVEFQPYIMSFMYYAVCQRKEYWVNDVALFDYNENGLFYYQMSTSRKASPTTVTTQTADLSDLMDASMLDNMQESRLQYSFRLVRDKVIQRQIISTILVTGKGFEGTWPDEILRSMTTGRHVLKGQNLYAKGAAYYARYRDDEKFADYLFLTEDMVRSTISIRMFKDNRIADYPLVRAGEKWKDIKAKTVGILDDTDEIYFTVFNAVRKDTQYFIMNLKNLHRRENKTTRVAIKVNFLDRDTAVCTVSDLGFGQFFPNSYRVWEKIISL